MTYYICYAQFISVAYRFKEFGKEVKYGFFF